jgi:dTDP-4-amino-4,6-dideoxygalactose transaminase
MFKGRKTGTLGDCAAFSFNQNKCLCTGEGGMFVTDNDDIRAGAAQLWSFGETRMPEQSRDYHAYALGWMYRLDFCEVCGMIEVWSRTYDPEEIALHTET